MKVKSFDPNRAARRVGRQHAPLNFWGLLPSVYWGVDLPFLCFSHFEGHSHSMVGMEVWTCILVGETQFCLLPFRP